MYTEMSQYDHQFYRSSKDFRDKLLNITYGCRIDMHEPDEQDLEVPMVIGEHLDNAFGDHIEPKLIKYGRQEYIVVMHRYKNSTKEVLDYSFNLATLIAYARIGARMVKDTRLGENEE